MRLKNTADNFSASFHITPPYQMMVIHSSKLIYPRELYQRGIQRKRVELIAKDFNEYTANEPKVSFRNGRYYVTDGQHTIEARILRNGGKHLPILCKIYTGLTMQQEALFFAEQNGHAADGGHQAPCQGGGRGCSFRCISRSHQPGGSGLQL